MEIANEKLWAAEFELGTDGVEAVVKDYVAKAEVRKEASSLHCCSK